MTDEPTMGATLEPTGKGKYSALHITNLLRLRIILFCYNFFTLLPSFLSSLFASAICPAGDMVPTSEPTLEPSLEPTKDGDNGLLATSGATVVAGGAFAAWASVCVGALSAFF